MEKEPWEEENQKFFVYLVQTYSLGNENKLLNDVNDFIRTQREQAITDYLKGEGAQQYIAEIKEQAKREGVEAAIELIPDDLHYSCDGKTCDCMANLKQQLRSKLLNN